MVSACGTQTPQDRFREIQLASNAIRGDSKEYLQEFQISIEEKPALVTGRVLAPPRTKGLDGPFHISSQLNSWCVVNFDESINIDKMKFFVENLRKEARNRLGMAIQEPKKYANAPLNQPGIVGGVFARAKKECGSGLQMIMFIIPDGHPVYNDIKLVGMLRCFVNDCY